LELSRQPHCAAIHVLKTDWHTSVSTGHYSFIAFGCLTSLYLKPHKIAVEIPINAVVSSIIIKIGWQFAFGIQ
jgi:hypothetical protein